MSYRSPLETRIAKKTTKAITDFNLIEDGDRIMVGLSGGKDSWALLQTLDILRKRAPIQFSLIAVNVDSGYKDFKHDLIAKTCTERGWEYRIEHTTIGEIMDDVLEANATPCSLCARLRRGVLYRIAGEVGATKIALGHHLDARLRRRRRGTAVHQGDGAADHRLLLSRLRRPEPAAAARQAADTRPRTGTLRREAVDAESAAQCDAAPPARHPSQSERRTA
jgi:hypothetical protein